MSEDYFGNLGDPTLRKAYWNKTSLFQLSATEEQTCYPLVEAAALWHSHANPTGEEIPMLKKVFTLAFLCAGFWSSFTASARAAATNDDDHASSATQPVNPVIEWNRTLLVIVRTPGAQPSTIHSTRSFAMLHAAIFD